MLAIPSSSKAPPRPRGVDLKDDILKNLLYEVRSKFPPDQLSPELAEALEALPPGERRDLVNTLDLDDCSSLFHSCRMGNVAIAKYLVETCGADIEQCGKLDMFSEERPHVAPPLWAASVYGGIGIVEYLLSRGANVNATSNSRSTPVRSACFMSNIEIVHLLVESGADIFITNQCGGSCLTNAVQSPDLCRFLLDRGAEVNAQDIQGNTPLHYCVMERRQETTQVLLAHGADIFRRNMYGQSPLQLSADKGGAKLYEFMTQSVKISFPEESDMLELMGFYEKQDKAIEYWVKAAQLREREGFQKPALGYWPRYASLINANTGVSVRRIHEYTTATAWESIAQDRVVFELQSLLIAERILGNFHKDFLKRLGKFEEVFHYDNPNFFAMHASQAYGLQMEFLNNGNGILCLDTSVAIDKLMGVFKRWRCHEIKMDRDGFQFVPIPFELLMESFNFLLEHLPEVTRQISLKPHLPKQRDAYDTYIVACSHLLNLLISAPRKREDLAQVAMAAQLLMSYALPVYSTGDTLLHLALRRFDYKGIESVPNLEHVRLLLHFGGVDVNAVNLFKENPLHVLLKHPKYEEDQVAEMLVDAGTHLDSLDSSNFCPLQTLMEKPFPGFPTNPPFKLRCIAAKYLGNLCVPYDSKDLPQEVVDFVVNHARVDTCATHKLMDLYGSRRHRYY